MLVIEVIDLFFGKKAYLKNYGENYLKVIVADEYNDLFVITAYWISKARIEM